MESKKCFKCGKIKPLSEFYEHKEMRDGHLNKCKECTRADTKNGRDTHPERDLSTRLRACEKNPSHENANRAVDAALRSGVLDRPDRCQGCGRSCYETRLSAHHYDYTKPLDVIWLCAACHRHVDRIRAYVDSGKSWSEYKSVRNRAYCIIKRAIDLYMDEHNGSSLTKEEVMQSWGA